MEFMCDEIKNNLCLDFTNEEVQDITEAVDIMVNRFSRQLLEEFPSYQIRRLVRCGSMEEKTRIWSNQFMCDIEFDYLAVLSLPQDSGLYSFRHSCPGAMEITCKKSDGDFFTISSEQMKQDFLRNVITCAENKCLRNCGNGYNVEDGSHVCAFCSVEMDTGSLRNTDVLNQMFNCFNLSFTWSSKIGGLNPPYIYIGTDNFSFKIWPYLATRASFERIQRRRNGKLYIRLDFSPVVELDLRKVVPNEGGQEMLLNAEHEYFLFPKNCSGKADNCWRISTCLTELEILKNTSAEHRHAFSVLKVFREISHKLKQRDDANYVMIHSYEVKLIVLDHIIKCKKPNRGAHVCLLEILHDLSDCNKAGVLIHPVLAWNACSLWRNTEKSQSTATTYFFIKCLCTLLEGHKSPYRIHDLMYDTLAIYIILAKLQREKIGRTMNSGLMIIYLEIDDDVSELQNFVKERSKNNSQNTLMDIAKQYPRVARTIAEGFD